MLLTSFSRLQRVDPGFNSGGVLTFHVALPDSTYRDDAARAAFVERFLAKVRALPGVRDVGGVLLLPLSGDVFNFTFKIEGRPAFRPGEGEALVTQVATLGYFRTLGIPLIRGRWFNERDTANDTRVMLLSQSAARRFFPNEDPVGKRITLGWKLGPKQNAGGEVVGIVGDVREVSLRDPQPPEAYLPHLQVPIGDLDVVVGTTVSPLSVARTVERAVHEIDPDLPLARVSTLERRVAASIAAPRFYTLLLGGFAILTLSLAAIGVFGVMSFLVAQRTREIGIRVALGCEPGTVMREVIGRAMTLAGIGLAMGLAIALPLSRALSGFLFETAPTEPLLLCAVVVLLAAVALAASYLPARRATKIDPLVALRAD